MFEAFKTVGTQVLLMLVLMILGVICRKVKFTSEEGIQNLTDIMLCIVTPCVIVKAFDRSFDAKLLGGFFITAAVAVAVHAFAIGLGWLIYRKSPPERRKILQFGTIFGNCGFFAIPVLEAILGDEGVFYGAAYLAVFNITVWTYGLWFVSRGGERIRVRKILLHPGILSVALGMILFFTPITMPKLVADAVGTMAGFNMPIPMLIIGYYLAEIEWKTVLRWGDEWLLQAVKLLLIPGALLAVLYLIGLRGTLLTSIIVSSASPVAAICTMFCQKYGGDSAFSAQTVTISTVLSLISITLLVGLTQLIA